MLVESLRALNLKQGGVYMDATFGRGGHAEAILEQIGTDGRLLCLDRDTQAVAAAAAKFAADPRVMVFHAAFSALGDCADRVRPGLALDGILFDLGVSSPQLDERERGFSFRTDGPLDMRMDRSRGQTAAEWLATADESELTEVIRDYGEERFARKIARAVVTTRKETPILTTRQLSEIVAQNVHSREPGKNPATRTFQAIRIYINRELEELESVLPQCMGCLKTGGRMAVISFHSLEDRIVKRFMRDMSQGDVLPKNLPIRAVDIPKAKMRLVGKAIHPSNQELEINPRARSAVLRVAEFTGGFQ